MKKYNLLFLGCVLSFFACEKEIKFKGDETEPQLTLNSFLTPDTTVGVHLSKSRFFLSNEAGFPNVLNAVVTLSKNGEVIETLRETGDGYYAANYRPAIGDRLQLKASAPGLNPVEASADILPAPLILSVETTNPSNDDNFIVTLKDPSETADYYRIDLSARFYDEKNDVYYTNSVYFDSDDIVFDSGVNDPFGENRNTFYVFSDELFNGKEYKLKLNVSNAYQEAKQEVYVDLQHITKDYYLYLKSRDAAGTGNEAGGLFTEPVQIYNNIRGGVGILGSYTSSVYRLSW
ncbi:MAG: DUF4249 domain-containing protein [Dysgonamonadaceae bacterium]|jgi:hypothetical protein|nr:DUF4249 domain-containing protein [Dysgonamonadaceae bacterium]